MKPEDKEHLKKTGFYSSDKCWQIIKAFCNLHAIPYSKTFTSIYVEDSKKSFSPWIIGYGELTVFLKTHILSDLCIVCSDDFQDTVFNAYEKEKSGIDINTYLSEIYDLTTMNNEQRKKLLFKLIQDKKGKYIEARIFRSLNSNDVDYMEDHSFFGQLENLNERNTQK